MSARPSSNPQVFVAPAAVPKPLRTNVFSLEQLGVRHLAEDFAVCLANASFIRATRGGDWPPDDLTADEDLVDLAFHQREFELGRSFAYLIRSSASGEMIGCAYIFPPGHPFNGARNASSVRSWDAYVNFWVSKRAFQRGLHTAVADSLEEWLRAWPFKQPHLARPDDPSTPR